LTKNDSSSRFKDILMIRRDVYEFWWFKYCM
jgi:hypothetical protein